MPGRIGRLASVNGAARMAWRAARPPVRVGRGARVIGVSSFMEYAFAEKPEGNDVRSNRLPARGTAPARTNRAGHANVGCGGVAHSISL